MVMRFIADRSLEIVVLIEGNDSTTGGVVQARHSYTGDDILWNTSFVPCVLQDDDTGGAVIDYSLFHHTEHSLAAKENREIEEASGNISGDFTNILTEDNQSYGSTDPYRPTTHGVSWADNV